MKKTFLISIIILFVLVSFANAAPPFVETAEFSTDGLIIEFPLLEFHTLNEDIDFHFFIFNISDGILMNKTTPDPVSCVFHLFNNTGEYIHDVNDVLAAEDGFEVIVDGNNFSSSGHYGYVIHCNTSTHGGSLSSSFTITETGRDDSLNYTPVIIIIIFFTILMIGCIILSVTLQQWAGKVAFGLLTLVFIMSNFMFMYLLMRIMNLSSIANLLLPYYHLSVLGVRYGLLATVFFLLYWSINMFFSKKHRKSGLESEELGEL